MIHTKISAFDKKFKVFGIPTFDNFSIHEFSTLIKVLKITAKVENTEKRTLEETGCKHHVQEIQSSLGFTYSWPRLSLFEFDPG